MDQSGSLILAMESSCDETAVALVSREGDVQAHALASQIDTHRKYGGVVPEVASRAHFETLDALVSEVLNSTNLRPTDVRAVAATSGPGLLGPLLVGVSYAQGLARGWGCPFIGVHHLRGHLASSLLGIHPEQSLNERAARVFPALVLLVSGGHTQILEVDERLRARKLADTADDAAGECFDKSAKLMGLGYPGGPALEALALKLPPSDQGRAKELFKALPRPRSDEGYSFSGLKTAVRLKLEKDAALTTDPAFAWAVQEAIADTLIRGLDRQAGALESGTEFRSLVFCGGVAANRRLRARVGEWAASKGLELVVPPLKYCTDNAVMIATAAWIQDPALALPQVIARTPLEPTSAS